MAGAGSACRGPIDGDRVCAAGGALRPPQRGPHPGQDRRQGRGADRPATGLACTPEPSTRPGRGCGPGTRREQLLEACAGRAAVRTARVRWPAVPTLRSSRSGRLPGLPRWPSWSSATAGTWPEPAGWVRPGSSTPCAASHPPRQGPAVLADRPARVYRPDRHRRSHRPPARRVRTDCLGHRRLDPPHQAR